MSRVRARYRREGHTAEGNVRRRGRQGRERSSPREIAVESRIVKQRNQLAAAGSAATAVGTE